MLRKVNIGFLALACLLAISFTACRTRNVEAPPSPAPHPQPLETTPKPAASGLKLPGLFSDNMVLQQGKSSPVWGWAADGEIVTVSFHGQKISTTAKSGKWMVHLHNLKAGGPETLTINSDRTSIQLTNVLVGEVWICSGQSNMEWPLNKAHESQADIASATNEMIRLINVPNTRSDTPLNDIKAKWTLCTPETAAPFSAVGYYFGRDLQAARHVPIGLIQSDWGGTPVEAWTSHETLEKNPRIKAEVLDTYPAAEKAYTEAVAAFEKEKADALLHQREFKKWAPWKPWKPSELYNGMIAPLVPYAMKGVIWYQGENNAPHAAQYHFLFPEMIRDWRKKWGNDFTFCCVQLAPFKTIQPQPGESDWAELREAQLEATKLLPNVGMAVITDVGEQHDIHPKKKGPVGSRLALAARALAYGEKIPYSGPIFKTLKIEGRKAILTFDHVGTGLEMRDGAVKGFAICGEDHKWVWALADIVGTDTVVVKSPNVPNPVAVRFGWADYPVVTLWNKEGLPASPFRTDNFPMITEGKK